MSFIGLIKLESLGKNCDRKIIQPINDLIPHAVIGIGRLVIDCILEPRGVMVGIPFLLDNSKPIYFTECLKACTLLSVNNKPYSFSLCKKNVSTLICVSRSGVNIIQSSMIHLIYSLILLGSSDSISFINAVKNAGLGLRPCASFLNW
jgi:hypothetical protein